jgi:2-polyprenyl-6-methoxyphenol hydroxylase-like FAD-dependent oxidoreductase
MNNAYDADVLVVGAGPVGLTLAIDLAQRGVKVQLVERNDTCRQWRRWSAATRAPWSSSGAWG